MVAWELAHNMVALRNNSLTVWPGMTIYTVGDLIHAEGVSDHNPDDTTLPQGGRAAQSDADSTPEVRALDWMIGPRFTAADARNLVAALRDPRSLRRLFYIIYDGWIYRRDGSKSRYTGDDPHTNHVHGSGWAANDADTSAWPAVLELGADMTPDESAMLKEVRDRMRWVDGRVHAEFTDSDVIADYFPVGAGTENKNKQRLLAIQGAAEAPSTVAVDQAMMDAAVRSALMDPAVLAGLATAINEDAARRMQQ